MGVCTHLGLSNQFRHILLNDPISLFMLCVVSNNQSSSSLGNFPLPFSFLGAEVNLISKMNVNIHKVELWMRFVHINFGIVEIHRMLPNKYILIEGNDHPLEHSECSHFPPALCQASYYICLKKAGPFRKAASCQLFGVRGARACLYISQKGSELQISFHPGFLIPLLLLTSRERRGFFQPPTWVCK